MPSEERTVEREAPASEEGYWLLTSITDLPDLEFAMDPNTVEDVWYLRAEVFEKIIHGEPRMFDIPLPGGSTGMFTITEGYDSQIKHVSLQHRIPCSGQITGDVSAFRFNLQCDDQAFILEPLLRGSNAYYALYYP